MKTQIPKSNKSEELYHQSKEVQTNLDPKDLKDDLRKRSEYFLDLDNLKPQQHNWIDRGVVVSCEGAAHPNHRVYKRTR